MQGVSVRGWARCICEVGVCRVYLRLGWAGCICEVGVCRVYL